MVSLESGDFRLELAPQTGGSIIRLAWRGEDLLRPGEAGDVLGVSHFPMVPFCNRIAEGRFRFGDSEIVLDANMPAAGFALPLHGYGWLGAWTVAARDHSHVVLDYDGSADPWPWSFRAQQTFRIAPGRFEMALAVTNHGAGAMPTGLGFHPYFPRNSQTLYHALQRERWTTNAAGLPDDHAILAQAADWWHGLAVETQVVDDIFAGREGVLTLLWPDRALGLHMIPSAELVFTTVFAPENADFVCVEPATQMTDAFNRGSLQLLQPGETREVTLVFKPFRTAGR